MPSTSPTLTPVPSTLRLAWQRFWKRRAYRAWQRWAYVGPPPHHTCKRLSGL